MTYPTLTPEQRRQLVEAPLPTMRIYAPSYGHAGTTFLTLSYVGPGREHCPKRAPDQHDSGEWM